jgi:broad specificity phosphatase PhoE
VLILLSPPETALEEQTIWVGNADSKLSQRGHAAAKEFALYDMWIIPDRVYTSPVNHMLEFCSIILPETTPIQLPNLIDRSMGTLTGRTYRETMAEFPRRIWLAWQRSYWSAPPDGESLFDISDRVITTFRTQILPIEAHKTVLLIVAPDVMRLIIGYLVKMEEIEIPRISVEPLVPYVVNGTVG